MKTLIYFVMLFLSIPSVYSDYRDGCPNFIFKSRWGARSPTAVEYSVIPIKYVIIHHTVTPTCYNEVTCSDLLKNIQNYHMNTLKFHDIGYNFLIGGDGNIYEGAGWHKVGAHTKAYNTKAIGLAFIGNFTSELPNKEQLNAARDFLKYGVKLGEIDQRYKLLGARTISATQSPGLALFREIQTWKGFSRNP